MVTKTIFFATPLDTRHMRETFYDLQRQWPYLASRLRKGRGRYQDLWTVHVPMAAKLEELIRADHLCLPARRRIPMFSSEERDHESLFTVFPFAKLAQNSHKLPQSTPTIAKYDRNELLRNFTSSDSLQSFEDYFKTDAAIFAAHVVNFADGAAFTFTVPHACFDGAGAKKVLVAYLELLRGEPMSTPPPPLGYDPFSQYAPDPSRLEQIAQDGCDEEAIRSKEITPPPPEQWRVLGVVGVIVFLWYTAYDYFFDRPVKKMDRVMIYLPPKYVNKLKDQTRTEIEAEYGAETANSLRLSRANAMHAWVLKNELARRVDVNPDRMAMHGTLANIRYRLPRGLASIHPNYTSNCLAVVATPSKTTRELAASSMGAIAYDLRETLQRQTTPEAMEEFVRWQSWRGTPASLGGGMEEGGTAVFFPTKARFTMITDWTKFGLWDLDFSGALPKRSYLDSPPSVDNSDASSTTTVAPNSEQCRMLAILCDSHNPLYHRNGWIMTGGRDGGCWILGSMTEEERRHPEGWGRFDDAVIDDAVLHEDSVFEYALRKLS
ncbi:hypothetical protein OC846_002459 [Tilletia horrida]|uniref:Uncharacterized protein n=1 Tax=Tilletia horrida TaxID=155126 RepID=A0AAN6GU43_9BASI|nr:hypothetical protein OC846_002459 [Tilletia horrida]KAK0567532.1 hypothetical protein OC861_002653 [Tilletia horrida]